jgi:chromosome segregation protein
LGEQSAKSLRGAKMEDIIFAGTANRRQLGFAEVILVIDNTDSRLPIDFSEISVARRVYRSGESEYQINGTTCRLRDIHEMFMDTGIGKEGYSIIGQGRIEEILSTRSEDRRVLFEEAAGIVKYKNRKHEAEQKLDRERLNLLRVSDIIAELESQIAPLHEQSEAAKEYLALKERLKLLQVNMFLLDADKSQKELDALDENISALAEQVSAEAAARESIIVRIAELKQEHDALASEIKQHEEQSGEAKVTAESYEGDIRLAEEQIAADIERLFAETEQEKARLAALNASIEEERERQAEIEQELARAESDLLEKQKSYEAAGRRMSEGEQKIGQFNALIISKMQEISDTRAREQKSKAAYERLQEIKEELNDERESGRDKANENAARLNLLEEKLAALAATSAKAEADISVLLRESTECNDKLEAASEELKKRYKSYNESRSRHKLLAEMESGYEGYHRSVKSVLVRKGGAGFEGICGAVAELLDVDAKYETAIEIALGGAAQNIITETEDDAIAAIKYLKANNEGRATFQPLSAVKGRDFGAERTQLLAGRGVCGIAKELIRYNKAYENVFSSLLGRVLVADDIHNAVALAKKHGHTHKIVTLEGELLSPGGAMSGGSSHKAVSLFSRGRELKELKKQITALESDIERLKSREEALNNELAAIKGQIEEKRGILQSAALEQAGQQQSYDQAKEALQAFEELDAGFAAKDADIMEKLLAANKEMRGYESTIADIENEVAGLHEQRDIFQSNMLDEKEEQEEGVRELINAKAALSALEQQIAAAKDNIARMESEASGSRAAIEKHGVSVEARNERKQKSEDRLNETLRKLEELKEKQQSLDGTLDGLNKNIAEKSDTLALLEQTEREKMELLAGLNAENVRLEMKKEQVTENSRRLYDAMWDEYAITYQTALAYERLSLTQAQLARDERGIKSEIQALGDVNVGAIEEYKNVKERFEFLAAQREDIIAAEDKLMGIIAQLTELMARQFAEQFRLISENFAYVFREMFGGGTAYLKLQDENNVLETGIDIIAQPPGKILQNMSLLSGGERALTATALLFGILRMKPSPFCILDEVESALDDSNVIRYAKYLKNFADDTQFILITHRKGTMEAADVLYGVTMQEQGVSKLVSVKLTE